MVPENFNSPPPTEICLLHPPEIPINYFSSILFFKGFWFCQPRAPWNFYWPYEGDVWIFFWNCTISGSYGSKSLILKKHILDEKVVGNYCHICRGTLSPFLLLADYQLFQGLKIEPFPILKHIYNFGWDVILVTINSEYPCKKETKFFFFSHSLRFSCSVVPGYVLISQGQGSQ